MVDFVSLFTGMSERDIGFLLKSIVQDSINSELTNADISEIDNKTQVLITNSKDVELMNDISIQSAINIEPSTVYLMPEEPDGINLKLWLKFQNAGELRDWSYQKNKSYATGGNTMPGLFSKFNDDSMLKYELYSYFNGISHYAYTQDALPVRILPNITASKITSFFMRLVPVSLAKVLYAENNALFTKVDDDQLRYGYSVTVDSVGNLNFYIRNNYVQYHLPIKDAYNYILTDPLYETGSNFRFENFSKKNFLTGFEFLCGLVAAELPFHDWFFKYNPTTHNMSIINTTENNPAAVVADTSLITQVPYLSCPIQEGKYTHSGTVQTTIYDNSTHTNNGTISGYVTGGIWNDDNTLTSLGSNTGGTSNGISVDFSSISSLNSLTEFTISFWYNPLTELINNKSYNTRLFSKGYGIANSIYIERTTGVNDLKFSFRSADNVEKSVTFSNPFPVINKWYFVIAKWKSGEKLKLSINNANEVQSASTVTTTLSTASNTIKLYDSAKAPVGIMALLKVYTVQISQATQDNLYYQGYHNPLFPKSENIQPVASPTPDPVFVPFTNAYTLDKMTTPVLTDYRKINSLSGDNPFVQKYNVVDGTSATDPELNPYTIADGTTGGGGVLPFNLIYTCTDPSHNSFMQLDESGDNYATAVEIQSGSGLIGKKVTKAIFSLKGASSPTGTVNCKIWDDNGDVITELWYNGVTNQTLNAASVNTSTSTQYTFENTDITPWGSSSLALGWRIGIAYGDGGSTSDQIQVKRNQSNPRSNEWATTRDYAGTWDTNIDNDDLVADLYEGGTGSPTTEPNIIMKSGSYNRVAEAFGTGDALIGKIIGKVTLRLKKVGSPTGTASIVLMNNASTVKATLGTINVATLTTSTADYTFTNYTHGVPAALVDRIAITWTPSASGEVHVMTNNGNTGGGNTWNGTNSSVFRYISSWSATGLTGFDLSGKIYTGGNNFDAFLRFSNTRTRITVKAVNSSSSIHNKKLTKIVVRVKKTGSPLGIMTCYVRDSTDAVKVTYSSVDVSTLTTSYADVEFTNVVHTYLMNSGTGSADKVSVEYGSADSSNYVELNINHDVIDTVNTIAQTYDSGNYVDNAQIDIAGKMYEGGEPDLNSRTRIVQSIEHQNSRLKAKKITQVKAFLMRTTTSTSGTTYCNIRRGTDDSLVKTLGTVSVSTLSTTAGTPSQITFTDTTNNYPLNVGDKISIEYNGGSTTDQVGVLVRSVTPNYDLSNSYIRKYDEVDYDDVETTMDLCAVMDEGGFFFTPDAGSIPDPTPTNIKDLLFCAGNNALSGFFETLLMEFRIYSKDITLDNADYLYDNRYSISPISPGAILCPFSLKMNTTDPI